MATNLDHYAWLMVCYRILKYHFRGRRDLLIACDLLVYYKRGEDEIALAPDVFVSFGVPPGPRRATSCGERAIRRTWCGSSPRRRRSGRTPGKRRRSTGRWGCGSIGLWIRRAGITTRRCRVFNWWTGRTSSCRRRKVPRAWWRCGVRSCSWSCVSRTGSYGSGTVRKRCMSSCRKRRATGCGSKSGEGDWRSSGADSREPGQQALGEAAVARARELRASMRRSSSNRNPAAMVLPEPACRAGASGGSAGGPGAGPYRCDARVP